MSATGRFKVLQDTREHGRSALPQLISVVVPCYNESEIIAQTHQRLVEVLQQLDLRFEIVYVNDGSRDDTLSHLRRFEASDDRVRVVDLSRNFGHQAAVSAGLEYARGDAVVLIDADLQDPPEVIGVFVEKWRQGYDVAYGRRLTRSGETRFKLLTAKLFYRLINRMAEVEIPLDTGDFRLMDRRVVDTLLRMKERDRFLRGMISWIGYKQIDVPYERHPRTAGQSKYPLRKMLRFALDGIISFSLVPLKIATLMGLFASSLSVLGIGYALALRLFTDLWVSGWTLMFIGMLFFGGVQLLCLGVIGEYIGRIYMEVKRRPLYLVDEHDNRRRPAATGADRSVDTELV